MKVLVEYYFRSERESRRLKAFLRSDDTSISHWSFQGEQESIVIEIYETM